MPKTDLSAKKSYPYKFKFLLNANISRRIISELKQRTGFDFIHVSDISNAVLTDREIIKSAKKSDRIIITHDLDYGEIYYLEQQGTFGVIMLRLKNQSSSQVVTRLVVFLTSRKFRVIDPTKSLVIITDKQIRILS